MMINQLRSRIRVLIHRKLVRELRRAVQNIGYPSREVTRLQPRLAEAVVPVVDRRYR